MIPEEEQANLSAREVAIRTKQMLKAKNWKSPDVRKLFGCRVNWYTTFYYNNPQKRSDHLPLLQQEYGELESYKPQLIDPQ